MKGDGARAQGSEDQTGAGAHDVGGADDDERVPSSAALADHARLGVSAIPERVADGDQGRQNGDRGGAPAHRPHLRRDLEARDLDVLSDEMAEAERGLTREARHAVGGGGGHRCDIVVAGPANPSDARSPLMTVSMATSLPLSAALASAL